MSAHKPSKIQKDDEARPLRYVPSMGKRLKAAEGLSESARKAAHEALIAWNKP